MTCFTGLVIIHFYMHHDLVFYPFFFCRSASPIERFEFQFYKVFESCGGADEEDRGFGPPSGQFARQMISFWFAASPSTSASLEKTLFEELRKVHKQKTSTGAEGSSDASSTEQRENPV